MNLPVDFFSRGPRLLRSWPAQRLPSQNIVTGILPEFVIGDTFTGSV
ncbi:MAG TPA: hypothetical protein VN715_14875 [Roseiarcus sp.]|nr:hypothetical protein [Roseiarcus sp.]